MERFFDVTANEYFIESDASYWKRTEYGTKRLYRSENNPDKWAVVITDNNNTDSIDMYGTESECVEDIRA